LLFLVDQSFNARENGQKLRVFHLSWMEIEHEEEQGTTRPPLTYEEESVEEESLGSGEVEVGEEAAGGAADEAGITIAPRTPVLEHDPLRALASSSSPPSAAVFPHQMLPLPLAAVPDTAGPDDPGPATYSPRSTTCTVAFCLTCVCLRRRPKLEAGLDVSGSGGRRAPVSVNDDMDGLKTLMVRSAIRIDRPTCPL
jgi:hypothetical protein